MRVLFTGEKGQLARKIADYLGGEHVVEVRSAFQKKVSMAHPWPELDVRNEADVLEAFDEAKPDVVVHSAAIVNTDKADSNPKKAIDTNLLGTAHVLRGCERIGAKLLYFSTTATYDPAAPRPFREHVTPQRAPTLYGITKLAGEMLVTGQTKVAHMVVRPCFVFGDAPYDHSSQLVKIAVHQALCNEWPERAGERPRVTLDPEASKDYMRVEDFARAVIAIIQFDSWNGDVFNVSAYSPRPMREYFEELAAVLGVEELDMTWVPEADYMGAHVVNSDRLRACTDWVPSIHWKEGVHITAERAVQYVRDCKAGKEVLLYR